ncbi:MAG: AraC family transcriptional regulator [Hoeflea sp.]|uniref:AraC family transcriptional regulator n=1 Tax=Hoeflea sp. TaxID=1940281 RepID=UPI00272FCD7E|nr:AraC family transcriptional regulator [Hoeflea sp.]MDP2121702.1 AraC family transcriptional regulator [Hoeflea sp.]
MEGIISSDFRRDSRLGGLEMFSASFRQYQYRRHSHPGYVIGVVTQESESFYCRGATHTAGPGDILLINPQSLHDGEAATDRGWSYRVFYPEEQHFQGLSRAGAPLRFRQSVVRDAGLAASIQRLHADMQGPADSLVVQQSWAEVMLCLAERHGEAAPSEAFTRGEPQRIAMIDEMLREEKLDVINLDEVARRVGWTKWHLVRSYKAAKGISPYAFHLECKLRRAKSLIDRGESLVTAASEAGFADQSHFARHFTKTFGFTPGRYRQTRIA